MSSKITTEIAGQVVNNPVNGNDIQVEATFINTSEDGGIVISPQANVDAELLDFVTDGSSRANKAARVILQRIEDGRNNNGPGIFEGIPIKLNISDALNSVDVFNGIIDASDGFVELSPVRVRAKIREVASLNTFGERAQANTFGFLVDKEIIKDSDYIDVEYVVELKNDPLALLIAAITTYIMIRELLDAIKDLSDTIADLQAHLTGGITGPAAAAVWALAKAIIQAAYVAFILIAIIKLVRDMIANLVSPIRKHKAMRLRTLLDRATNYLGYELESPIDELDNVVYLASNPDAETPLQQGIPGSQDFGYKLDEMYDVVKRVAYAKLQLIDGVLQLRSLNDPFWEKTSTYVMPSDPNGNGLLQETKKYNTSEFKANRIIQFETDVNDEWTVNNFKGTNYEVISTPPLVEDERNVLMKGLDQVQIPCALGNRKDKLNAVEIALKALASAADAVISIFGGNPVLAKQVKRRVGMLKVGSNVHSVPKLLYLDSNNKMPKNHRQLLSAKVLYNKYHNEKSFVANDYGGQYEIYEDVRVPFGLNQFLQLIRNSYFTNFDGRLGKVDSIQWTMGRDFAQMNYRIQERYTKNIEETPVEPG